MKILGIHLPIVIKGSGRFVVDYRFNSFNLAVGFPCGLPVVASYQLLASDLQLAALLPHLSLQPIIHFWKFEISVSKSPGTTETFSLGIREVL